MFSWLYKWTASGDAGGELPTTAWVRESSPWPVAFEGVLATESCKGRDCLPIGSPGAGSLPKTVLCGVYTLDKMLAAYKMVTQRPRSGRWLTIPKPHAFVTECLGQRCRAKAHLCLRAGVAAGLARVGAQHRLRGLSDGAAARKCHDLLLSKSSCAQRQCAWNGTGSPLQNAWQKIAHPVPVA